MNRCDEYLDLLSSYLDGELPEDERKSVEQHLNECKACAAEYELLKQIVSTCSELEEDLPENFDASLHQRLVAAKEEVYTGRSTASKIRLFSQIAAGFVLVVSLGMLLRTGMFSPKMYKSSESTTEMAAPKAAADNAGSANMAMSATGSANLRSMAPAAQGNPDTDYKAKSSDEVRGQVSKVGFSVTEPEESMEIKFSESVALTASMARVEGQDTLVRIRVTDIGKSIDSILAIQEKLGDKANDNHLNLQNAKELYGGSDGGSVELKLVYSNDQLWQEFLSDMQGIFPDMQVESVPAQEEQEFIRVVVEKQ